MKGWSHIKTQKYKPLIIAVGLLLIIGLAYSAVPLSVLIPGPEGVRALIYGVQFGGGSVRKAENMDALPDYFDWYDNRPSNMIVQHRKEPGEPLGGYVINGPNWWYDHDSGQILVEVDRPLITDDPIGMPKQTLTYYKYERVDDGTVRIRKGVVDLIPVDLTIQLSAVPGKGVYNWRDMKVWFALDTVVWLNSYFREPPRDPNPLTNATVKFLSSSYRGAFPVVAWVGKYRDWVFKADDGTMKSSPPDDNAIRHVQLYPSLEGRYVDLFTSPDSKYNMLLSSDAVKNPELAARALQPDNMPDPRFAETVYFYILTSQFGPYVQSTSGHYMSYKIWYPSVYYRVRIIYAVYGEFVYLWTTSRANEMQYPGWTLRETREETFTDWFTWFASSFANFMKSPLGVLLMLLVAAVIIAVFAPWVLVAAVNLLSSLFSKIGGGKKRG